MRSRLDARLRRLEAQAQGTDDLPGSGLAALLTSARSVYPREVLDAPTPLTGLAQLLEEARQVLGKVPPV